MPIIGAGGGGGSQAPDPFQLIGMILQYQMQKEALKLRKAEGERAERRFALEEAQAVNTLLGEAQQLAARAPIEHRAPAVRSFLERTRDASDFWKQHLTDDLLDSVELLLQPGTEELTGTAAKIVDGTFGLLHAEDRTELIGAAAAMLSEGLDGLDLLTNLRKHAEQLGIKQFDTGNALVASSLMEVYRPSAEDIATLLWPGLKGKKHDRAVNFIAAGMANGANPFSLLSAPGKGSPFGGHALTKDDWKILQDAYELFHKTMQNSVPDLLEKLISRFGQTVEKNNLVEAAYHLASGDVGTAFNYIPYTRENVRFVWDLARAHETNVYNAAWMLLRTAQDRGFDPSIVGFLRVPRPRTTPEMLQQMLDNADAIAAGRMTTEEAVKAIRQRFSGAEDKSKAISAQGQVRQPGIVTSRQLPADVTSVDYVTIFELFNVGGQQGTLGTGVAAHNAGVQAGTVPPQTPAEGTQQPTQQPQPAGAQPPAPAAPAPTGLQKPQNTVIAPPAIPAYDPQAAAAKRTDVRTELANLVQTSVSANIPKLTEVLQRSDGDWTRADVQRVLSEALTPAFAQAGMNVLYVKLSPSGMGRIVVQTPSGPQSLIYNFNNLLKGGQ